MHKRLLLTILWCAFLVLQFSLAAVAADLAAPYERALIRTGQWETSFWGDEGRMAYRFTGGWEEPDDEASAAGFTLDEPTLLRTIVSVHINTLDEEDAVTLQKVIEGETPPEELLPQGYVGSVSIVGEDQVYGPFGYVLGSPAVLNGVVQETVTWVADAEETLLGPGSYTIEDHSAETAAMDGSGLPILLVKGVDAEAWHDFSRETDGRDPYEGSYKLSVMDEYGDTIVQDAPLAILDKGDQAGVTFLVADTIIDQSFDITHREKDLIEARSAFSVLPDQGVFELSIDLKIEKIQDVWVLEGTASAAVNGTDSYEVILDGTMTGGDMPGFYFPPAAAGLGSLGNIPGPSNEVEAAAGVVAPGLLALLASLLAGGRGQGGGGLSPLPVDPIPPTSWHPDVNPAGTAVFEPTPPPSSPINSHEPQVPFIPARADQESFKMDAGSIGAAALNQRMESETFISFDHASGLSQGRGTGNGFFKMIGEKMEISALQPLHEAAPLQPEVLGVLAERREKVRLIGEIESLLQSHHRRQGAELREELRSRLEALSRDVSSGRKDMIQAGMEFDDVRNLFEDRGDRASSLTASLPESSQQASGVATFSSLNEVGTQLAGDVASGALSEIGSMERI